MKVRNGFVSNSSTSSFICEVCGRTESGYDGDGCAAYDMTYCENEHTYCNDEASKETGMAKNIYSHKDSNETHETNCPICLMEVFSESDLSAYLEKVTGVSREEAFAEVKKLNKRRKKLYNGEYNMYVCTKNGLSVDKLMEEAKAKYGDYIGFHKFVFGR